MKIWHVYRNGRPTSQRITPQSEPLWPGKPLIPHIPIRITPDSATTHDDRKHPQGLEEENGKPLSPHL